MTGPGLPPAGATVACQDVLHRLKWADGVLTAVDHDDIGGELVLSALGGEPAPCAQIVAAWRQAADDLRVLVLSSRGPADPLGVPQDDRLWAAVVPTAPVATSNFGWYAYSPLSSSASPATRGRRNRQMRGRGHGQANGGEPDASQLLTGLLELGGGLPERLVATVVDAWAGRLAAGTAPVGAVPALTAALSARAGAAVRQWRHDPGAEVAVTMLPAGSPGTVRTVGDVVALGLPFSWLADVWVPGLAVLLDRFTLAATADGPRLVLDTIGAPLDREKVVIMLPD